MASPARPLILFCVLMLASLALPAVAAEVTYALGSWAEDGQGNHRAVVRVAEPADAVWAHIQWRRRDRDPEAKDVRVVDLATGQRVTNVVRAAVTREAGDILFQPQAPGDYAVYYLPYTVPRDSFANPGDYYPPQDTADPGWRERNGLTEDGLRGGAWRSLPQAALQRIEARTEFDRLDPMEIVATPAEAQDLLGRHPGAAYLVFPEDRVRPIRMLDELPTRWITSGPSRAFSGAAQPGEFYCFQLGVWAARADLGALTLETTDLRTPDGRVIPRDQTTCYNLGGTDWLGKPFTKSVTVPRGRVQPLWIGLQVPRDAAGTYTGTFTVAPAGAEPWPVQVSLNVSGDIMADGGVSDLWRMSRLQWLNSTLGLDDEVVPPFTPLEVRGNTISCLLRDVRFGPLGLPASITSSKREVLAAPMTFTAMTSRGPLRFTPTSTRLPKVTPGKVERVTCATSPQADLAVHCSMEADGVLMYRVTLTPRRALSVSDLSLEIPQRLDCAPYMMGLGKRGGFRPPEWRWKWDRKRANNMVWLGDVGAGMQLQLRGEKDVWEPVALSPAGFAPAWDNGGRGGCDVTEAADRVLVKAYTGKRILRAGEPLELRFRLIITPLKPIDPQHWNWRYGDPSAEATVLHIHHGTPELPYINYPFRTVPLLTDTVRTVKASSTRYVDPGELSYPAAGNIDPRRGAVHLWVTVNFDPSAGMASQSRYNQSLFSLTWPDQGWVGYYWNIDDRGMRGYVATGSQTTPQIPILIPSSSPGWQRGQKHLLTLTWGDEFSIYVDGQRTNGAPFPGTLDLPLDDACLRLDGRGFILNAIKTTDVPYTGDALPTPIPDEHTLLLDTFTGPDTEPATRPERGRPGKLIGTCEITGEPGDRALRFSAREEPGLPRGVNVYDNVGQMSSYAAEIWVNRSLGDEIMPTRSTNPTQVGGATFGTAGGGYPWLREHLVSDYLPGWLQPLPWLGETDASLEMQPLSRWHNYYVEGLGWLMRTTGVDGLYLDGISYDREIMKRVAKTMLRVTPQCRLNCHGGDNWSAPWDPDRLVSTANAYLEHFPYLSNLWFGELYDYNMPPDYWLVEMSGIPFGLTGEMLDYQTGGNPYRAMLYGMTGRLHPSCTGMWGFWDSFGIQDAQWLGYWDPKCPVKTGNPSVLATVYRKPGKSLIALGHWPGSKPRPAAVAAEAVTAPSIDGSLAPGEWDAAARLANFTTHGGDELAADQTQVYVTWDRQRLYFAFRCAQSAGTPKADISARDGNVWEDDSVEVFLQPDPRTRAYFQFIGNSAGAIYDGRGPSDPGWNGDWTYRASAIEGGWVGEASIPLASLGLKPGASDLALGLNICRDQARPAACASCWSPVTGSYHNPAAFGGLTLSSATPSTRQELVAPGGSEALQVSLQIDWKALGLDPRRAKITAPAIRAFQPAADYTVGQPVPIQPARGALLVVEQ